jgi:hypothetical protein
MARLVGDVVRHVDLLRALDEQSHLGCRAPACRGRNRAVGDADRLSEVASGVAAGVVAAEADVARSQRGRLDVDVLGTVVPGRLDRSGERLECDTVAGDRLPRAASVLEALAVVAARSDAQANTDPLANGDWSSVVIGAPPPHGVLGTNL